MAQPETMRVRAVGDARLPVPGMRGRYVGRDPHAAHAILVDGVEVPADGYHRKAVRLGDLIEVTS